MQNRKRDTDVQNRILDSVGKGEGGMFQENNIETYVLSRVKQITSPGWMHETSARAWCTGKTQRDGWRGRWEGGSGWGIHVNLWLIHVNVWQKPLQYCKVISLQLIKINGKRNCKKKKKNPAYNAGDMGFVPGYGTKILHAVEQVSSCHSYWDQAPWSVHATPREAHMLQLLKPMCPGASVPQLLSLHATTRGSGHHNERSHMMQPGPNTAK